MTSANDNDGSETSVDDLFADQNVALMTDLDSIQGDGVAFPGGGPPEADSELLLGSSAQLSLDQNGGVTIGTYL